MPFQQIGAALKAGKARAGVLIHEGQLTYKADGLVRVMDLGQWWGEKTEGLPLPLGGMAIRRDIPTEERAKIALDLKRSIAYALGHREEALDYAMPFGRGLSRAAARQVRLDVRERADARLRRARPAGRAHALRRGRPPRLPRANASTWTSPDPE